MNLLYCGDRNIAAGLTLSALSVLRNNETTLNIFVITMAYSAPDREYKPLTESDLLPLRLELGRRSADSTVTLIDASDMFREELPELNLRTRFTPCCMLRLFADRIPEIPDRILYLDTDVLCRGSLESFYGQDLDGWEFAGVLDNYGSWLFRKNILRRDYCNSGVLLLNMKMIRSTGLFTKCRMLLCIRKFFMPDQSALNRLAVSKKLCPRRFNEQRMLHSDTVLQHFTTSFRIFPLFHLVSVKPWEFDRMHSVLKLHEYDSLFDSYTALCREAR